MDSFKKFLGDTYELIDVLKSSEKNFIALVYDKKAQRLCVVKERNLKSAQIYRALQDLNDSHVPEIYRLFEFDGKLIVVEEHIDGRTLEEILTYEPEKIDESFALEILRQLCKCLSSIHMANIVHRDIKPSNIMLTKNNSVKLVDFGIARTFKPEKNSDTELLGTRGYAPPEQFGLFDFGQTDARSDIYALGITIKQLLGENYDGRLKKILDRCTELEPSRRYEDAGMLRAAIYITFDNPIKKPKHSVNKILVTFGVFWYFLMPPADITDIPPPLIEETVKISAPEEISSEGSSNTPQGKNPPSVENSAPEKISQPIIPTPTPSPQIQTPQTIQQPFQPPTTQPLPPQIQQPTLTENPPKARERFEGMDLYFYVNGKLTGTDGSRYVYIEPSDNWRNWTEYKNGVLFPENWVATFRLENNSAVDLINPVVRVMINNYEFTVQKPTVKVGHALEVEIPLAGKFAAPVKGTGHLAINVSSPGRHEMVLARTFSLVK